MSGAVVVFCRDTLAQMQCRASPKPRSSVAGRRPVWNARDDAGDCARAHEASILITMRGAVGRWCGWQPGSKVSMTNMRPPARVRVGERPRLISLACGRGRGEVQALAHLLDRFGAIAAGEQAVVADAGEAPPLVRGKNKFVGGNLWDPLRQVIFRNPGGRAGLDAFGGGRRGRAL